MLAAILELLTLTNIVTHAPPLLTSVGVAYLVVVDRRRARQVAALENNVQALIAGHSSSGAHNALREQVKEQLAHVTAQH